MTITTIDQLLDALGNSAQQFVVNKASAPAQAAGLPTSFFRVGGTPAPGAIPAGAAICTKNLAGSFRYQNPTSPAESYIARWGGLASISATDAQLHDRLGHMGGLSGAITTAQTVGLDISGSGDNLPARRGDPDFSDVQWWLEWYVTTGATVATATITYTNAAGVSGRTTTVALTATMAAARLLPILGLGGEFIQSVQSVTLSASTGVAGSFGVTATRALTGINFGLANSGVTYDWGLLGFPKVANDACLQLVLYPGGSTTGTLFGTLRLVQG